VPHQLAQRPHRLRGNVRLRQAAHPQQIGKISRVALVFSELEK
jgi:hypothetical protein